MRLNELKPVPGSGKRRKRVGRGMGSGRGKTCGKGHKGQNSRSGGGVRPGFEGGQMPLQMRLPKFGFTSRVGRVTAEVRTGELNRLDAEVVDLAALRKAGVVRANIKRARIMLSGEVAKPLTIQGLRVSKGARAAIEAAGGKVIGDWDAVAESTENEEPAQVADGKIPLPEEGFTPKQTISDQIKEHCTQAWEKYQKEHPDACITDVGLVNSLRKDWYDELEKKHGFNRNTCSNEAGEWYKWAKANESYIRSEPQADQAGETE